MFEALQQGVVGLALFIGNWIAPAEGKASLAVMAVDRQESATVLHCRMDIDWNAQLEKLVDAGIPLRFRIITQPDKGEKSSFIRTLRFNVALYSYSFTDSSDAYTWKSKSYPLIYLALKDFCDWETAVHKSSSRCTVEAAILPSTVTQLKRVVDMRSVWGQDEVRTEITLPGNGK